MEADDDVLVVIVANEEDGSNDNSNTGVKIKEEVLDEGLEEMDYEKLIETAEKHGMPIPLMNLKNEPDLECLEEVLYDDPSDYDNDDLDNDDDDYFPNGDDEEDTVVIDSEDEYLDTKRRRRKHGTGSATQHRHAMLKPNEQRSFVKELCEKYPELKHDKQLLVDTLCSIMASIPVPKPPFGYFSTDGAQFVCEACGKLTESEPAMARHWQEMHGERYLKCFACGVDFRSKTNLYKHEKRCSAADALWVLKARAAFLGRKGRSRPFLLPRHHAPKGKYASRPERVFQCAYCTLRFKTAVARAAHECVHSGVRPYLCAQCPAAYTSRSGLHRHLDKHSGVVYICDICSRQVQSKNALVTHMNTHLPMKRYGCECGRRFATKMALRLHYHRKHLNLPPPCACQICPKRFLRMSLLKAHMLKEHGMNIITKTMFYKSLPLLSETQLKAAKVVFKSDESMAQRVPTDNFYENMLREIEETSRREREEREKEEIEGIPAENITIKPSAERVQERVNNIKEDYSERKQKRVSSYVKNIKDDIKCVVIENGEVIKYDNDNGNDEEMDDDNDNDGENVDYIQFEDDKNLVRLQIQELLEISGAQAHDDQEDGEEGKNTETIEQLEESIQEQFNESAVEPDNGSQTQDTTKERRPQKKVARKKVRKNKKKSKPNKNKPTEISEKQDESKEIPVKLDESTKIEQLDVEEEVTPVELAPDPGTLRSKRKSELLLRQEFEDDGEQKQPEKKKNRYIWRDIDIYSL